MQKNTSLLVRYKFQAATELPLLLLLASLVFLGGACERETWKPKEVDRKVVEVRGERMTLQSGVVGTGAFKEKSTYVLVDAHNPSSLDLAVTLGGAFLNEEGRELGKLHRRSLRIPAGGTRTFALVSEDKSQLVSASGATIEVTSAVRLDYPEQITITEFHEYQDGGRVVVAGYVQNTVGRIGRALVFATFYDAAGKPMKRPSTLFRLERKARRGVQFVGPPGSVHGTLSVGDIVY